MICPVCGSTNCEYAGSDTVVSVSADDYEEVEFARCLNCSAFGYYDNFIDPEDTQIIQLPLFEEDPRSWGNYS